MTALKDSYTSGAKFFAQQEAMKNLQNGKGQPVVTHLIPTDFCQHKCSFCSVSTRDGNVLAMADMLAYLDILLKYGLKAVIVSGGGNPILYKCPKSGASFNDLIAGIHSRGLEIGLITNGMPTREYPGGRISWKSVTPETLDMLTWVRISMSGLDHAEEEVFVPDIDPEKTTLGFSYVGYDEYEEPAHYQHGQVSTPADLITLDRTKLRVRYFKDRVIGLTKDIAHYAHLYNAAYVRMLPNCLEPDLIDERCRIMQGMAARVNDVVGREVAFVQYKPPKAPHVCLLGSVHPVLNSDGYVYPCDSVVLAAAEVAYRHGSQEHRFANPWRMFHWSEIAKLYDNPLPKSLIAHPEEICRGCVFTFSNTLLEGVRDGTIEPTPPTELPQHPNFV